MCKRFAIMTGAAALFILGAGSAHAFEQTPIAPAVPGTPPVVVPAEPKITFDGNKAAPAQPEQKSRGIKVPGLGKLSIPKLNFGLDLMYGPSETKDTDLGFSSDPAVKDDEVTIMGKVKRRF